MCFFVSDCVNSVEMYASGAQRVAYRLDEGYVTLLGEGGGGIDALQLSSRANSEG
jgi:hypothetical protein